MQRTRILWGSLAAFAMMLATGPAALAQQGQRNQGDQPAASDARQQSQDQQDRQQRRGQRAGNQQSMSEQQREAALEHFLAGYYAGYTDGWSDGSHDLVITVLDEQRRRARQQVASGRDPARMQPGRAAAREQMRNRMRGASGQRMAKSGNKSGNQRSGDRTRKRSAVSLKGEVIGLKTVGIRGTDVEHRVARIRTDNDRTLVIELGPKQQTSQFGIQEGDMIQVTGAPAMSGDMRILVAQQVTLDDQKASIKYKRMKPKRAGKKAASKARNRRGQSADEAGQQTQEQ